MSRADRPPAPGRLPPSPAGAPDDPGGTLAPEPAPEPAPEAASEAAPELAPYRATAALAERELRLARDGEIEVLGELAGGWRELRDQISRPHPAGAAPLLVLAASFSERAGIELQRRRELLLGALGATARAGRAARGYAGRTDRSHALDRRA